MTNHSGGGTPSEQIGQTIENLSHGNLFDRTVRLGLFVRRHHNMIHAALRDTDYQRLESELSAAQSALAEKERELELMKREKEKPMSKIDVKVNIFRFYNFAKSLYGTPFYMCTDCQKVYNPPVVTEGYCRLEMIGTTTLPPSACTNRTCPHQEQEIKSNAS